MVGKSLDIPWDQKLLIHMTPHYLQGVILPMISASNIYKIFKFFLWSASSITENIGDNLINKCWYTIFLIPIMFNHQAQGNIFRKIWFWKFMFFKNFDTEFCLYFEPCPYSQINSLGSVFFRFFIYLFISLKNTILFSKNKIIFTA